MISRIMTHLLGAALLLSAASAFSGDPVSPAVLAKMRVALEAGANGLKIQTVQTSVVPGMYEVQFIRGPLVYATEKGDFFIVGDLFSSGVDGYVNLTEKKRDGQRVEQLAAVKRDDMIVFPAQGETRAFVTVFTDVTCFYCQKLHKEVPELNKRGVEVRYLAYPRAGVDSDGFKQLASAWCADDPQGTLTRLKNKQTVAENVCAENPIAAQYTLGQELGVRGTPAIVTNTGTMIPGYQSADALIETLGLN